jgi:hypothetical protein
MQFKLENLSEQELNLVLNGIAQLPYIQVHQLIQKIQQQYIEQKTN